jgi:hypothetical protein
LIIGGEINENKCEKVPDCSALAEQNIKNHV